MAIVRGEQIIARCFKSEGVDTIFFMMGGPTSGTAGACLELGMKGIYVRHEQAAAMMAHAYARVTGKPGICITPMGPGIANVLTGLANAWADATPIIAIGGSAPMRGTTLDTFQEMDQVAMMRPVVKAAYRVDIGYRIPEYISIAFREALDGKKGPVYLDLPGDMLIGKVEDEKLTGSRPTTASKRGRPAIRRWCERAIELLAKARKRPIVVTGSGVLWSGAEAELREFVEGTGHSVLHHAARPRRHCRGPSAVVSGRALDGVSRGRRGAGDRRARELDAVVSARAALFARRQASSTSTSTAAKSATIARPKSASSATPSWCCAS